MTGLLSRRALTLSFLVGSWAFFFSIPLLGRCVPYYRDTLLTGLPIRQYLTERLRRGELPQWYPFESLGVPFIGQIVTATFHPQTLLFLAVTPLLAVKLNLLLYYLLATLGAYRLSRELGTSRGAATCGALAFGFGGYALGISNNLVFVAGLSTLPWVGWAALRVTSRSRPRDLATLALLWAMVFMAGDAQAFVLCGGLALLALAINGWRPKSGLHLAAAFALAVLLCSVELLPALRVSAESVRRFGTPAKAAGLYWALHPLRLLELLLPGFVPDEVRFRVVGALLGGGSTLWSTCLFAGSVPLVLAAVSLRRDRRVMALLALCVVSVWMALGSRGYLLPMAWKILPPLSRFRFPEKYLALFWVGFSALVALGTDGIRRRPSWGTAVFAGASAATLVLALASASGWLVSLAAALENAALSRELSGILSAAWARGALTDSGALLAATASLWLSRHRPSWRIPSLATVILVELWAANSGQLPLVRPEVLALSPFAERVRASGQGARPPDRVIPLRTLQLPSTPTLGDGERWTAGMLEAMRPDGAGIFGVTAFGDNLPGTSLRSSILMGPGAKEAPRLGPLFDGCFRTLEAASGSLPAGDALLDSDAAAGLILTRTPCRPLVYLAAASPVPNVGTARAAIMAGLADGAVVWEGGPTVDRGEGTIDGIEGPPERVRLQVTTDRNTALIVNDLNAHGWQASIDGQPTPIHPTNVAVQGLELPEGKHLVELRYETPWLLPGASGSCLALLIVLLLYGRGVPRLRARKLSG